MKHGLALWIVLLFVVVLGCTAPIKGSAPIRASEPASAAPPPGQDASQEMAAPEAERPGLGTSFGETRQSRTTTGQFVRDRDEPIGVATLWYNDSEGARAMASSAGYRQEDRPVASVLDGMITVRIEGEGGRVLPGFLADNRSYVIGQADERYAIVIQNHTGYRFEAVVSVDGLDVVDGRPASTAKRGYILNPNRTLKIEGFRTSADAVAAFRFSSVRGSYSARSGQGDQNVGVIGAAFYNEQGVTPTWGTADSERRKDANPFPAGGYTQPPPP